MRDVSDEEYKEYVDNDSVSEEILVHLALKIINRVRLATKEKAIFQGKTKEINEIIINIKNQKLKK